MPQTKEQLKAYFDGEKDTNGRFTEPLTQGDWDYVQFCYNDRTVYIESELNIYQLELILDHLRNTTKGEPRKPFNPRLPCTLVDRFDLPRKENRVQVECITCNKFFLEAGKYPCTEQQNASD